MLQWTLDPSVEVGSKAGEALHLEYFNALLGVKRIVLQENETGDIEASHAVISCTDICVRLSPFF